MRLCYSSNWRKWLFRASLVTWVISLVWFGLTIASYRSEQQHRVQAVLDLGQQEVSQAAQQIEALLQRDKKADQIATGSLTSAQIKEVRDLLASLSLGKTGYGYLINGSGTFLYHPLEEFIQKRVNIFNRAQELNSKTIQEIAERGIRGEKGVTPLVDPVTSESGWVFYYPVASIRGFLAVLIYENEVLPVNDHIKHKQLALGIEGIVCGFFLVVLVSRAWTGHRKSLWSLSISTGLLLAIGIGYTWYISLANQSFYTAEMIKINDRAGLVSFLDEYIQKTQTSDQPAIISIPTGIFIQTMKFEDANNVFVTGYIWQKFTKGVHDGFAQGFLMPEAITATDLGRWTEVYRNQAGDVETVGWYFEVTLRQRFDYSRYPFDNKNIQIRLWPKDFTSKTVLMPDLESYVNLRPKDRPGLELNLLLPGWNIQQSFFSYQFHRYGTDFGISKGGRGHFQIPELYFTVIANRSFLPVFISNFMPLLVITIMLFSIQLILSHRVQEEDARKFSALEIISVGGGLIFIVLLDQLNLRSNIVTAGLIYIEYIYFVLYSVIVLISLNALLIALGSNNWLIQYRDNLIPKLLYWPVLFVLLLFLTLISFY
jgi:hypothetical protein